MELTAKEILKKHIVVSEKFEVAILAAIKEAVELAYDAGGDRATFHGRPGIDDAWTKQEFINSLFPESK